MSNEQSLKRRAVYTGLKPFLDVTPLMEAIAYWEQNYADSPRFTLQRFVADICREHNLRDQRSDVLLSLVQSMNMPATALLPDPHADQADSKPQGNTAARGFCLLMSTLMENIPAQHRHSIRLDLYASIDQRKLPPALANAMQGWLGNDRPLQLNSAPEEILRALVNRTYVVLCERLGPVEADRLLAAAINQSQAHSPELGVAMAELL